MAQCGWENFGYTEVIFSRVNYGIVDDGFSDEDDFAVRDCGDREMCW